LGVFVAENGLREHAEKHVTAHARVTNG
jgi:hypothetical protein